VINVLCKKVNLKGDFLYPDAEDRGKDVRHSREGGNPEERKSGFRIKCGMTNYYIHFQLLIPRPESLRDCGVVHCPT
jgi:hypothetical protein